LRCECALLSLSLPFQQVIVLHKCHLEDPRMPTEARQPGAYSAQVEVCLPCSACPALPCSCPALLALLLAACLGTRHLPGRPHQCPPYVPSLRRLGHGESAHSEGSACQLCTNGPRSAPKHKSPFPPFSLASSAPPALHHHHCLSSQERYATKLSCPSSARPLVLTRRPCTGVRAFKPSATRVFVPRTSDPLRVKQFTIASRLSSQVRIHVGSPSPPSKVRIAVSI
jgi:hypothetical protein